MINSLFAEDSTLPITRASKPNWRMSLSELQQRIVHRSQALAHIKNLVHLTVIRTRRLADQVKNNTE
jgi:hypothetical protein